MRRWTLLGLVLSLAGCAEEFSQGPPNGQYSDSGGGNADSYIPGGAKRPSCPASEQVTINGAVLAPNGVDRVPGASVFIPSDVPEDFPMEVKCEVCASPGSSATRWWVSTSSYNGQFSLSNVCPGSYWLVLQNGRFRRAVKITVPKGGTLNLKGEQTRLPTKAKETSIHDTVPRIAVATGDYDKMECVLRKMGLDQSAYDLYEGAKVLKTSPSKTPFSTLVGDLNNLKKYNIVFINCTDNTYETALKNSQVVTNLETYVKTGGRLYVTDWSYDWLEQLPSLSPFIDFEPGTSGTTPETLNAAALGADGIKVQANIKDSQMAQWLGLFSGAITNGQSLIQYFLSGWVIMNSVKAKDVKVWTEGVIRSHNGAIQGSRPLTVTFNFQNCGKVLYSSYHTEGRDDELKDYYNKYLPAKPFPQYCGSSFSPQDRILEYLIFDIANCVTPIL